MKHKSKYYEYIAVNIRRLRKEKRYTQEVLSALASIDVTHLRRIEHAKADMSLKTFFNLADVLDVRPPDLLKKPDDVK